MSFGKYYDIIRPGMGQEYYTFRNCRLYRALLLYACHELHVHVKGNLSYNLMFIIMCCTDTGNCRAAFLGAVIDSFDTVF